MQRTQLKNKELVERREAEERKVAAEERRVGSRGEVVRDQGKAGGYRRDGQEDGK
jgi:hypothetical protein